MNLLLVLFWILVLAYSFTRSNYEFNRPHQFYFLSLLYYSLDILFDNYNFEIYLCLILATLVGLIMLSIELNGSKYVSHRIAKYVVNKKYYLALWIITLIPIISQILFIDKLGGFSAFVISIAYRVSEWRGLAIYALFRDFIVPLNIVYIILFSLDRRKSRVRVILLLLHIVIALVLGLASGSRTGALIVFVNIYLVVTIMGRKVSVVKLGILAFCLLIFSEFLGELRNKTSKFDNREGLTSLTEFSMNLKESKSFVYALEGLDLIYNDDYRIKHYGSTYIVGVTNWIPRSLWQNKPKSAGTLLTQYYKGKSESKYFGISPGVWAESIMNFGYIFGIPIGFSLLAISSIGISLYYRKVTLHRMIFDQGDLIMIRWSLRLMLALSFIQIPASLLIAESANVVFGLLKTLVYFTVLKTILKWI